MMIRNRISEIAALKSATDRTFTPEQLVIMNLKQDRYFIMWQSKARETDFEAKIDEKSAAFFVQHKSGTTSASSTTKYCCAGNSNNIFRAYVALNWSCHRRIAEFLEKFGGRELTENEVPIEPLLRLPCLDGLEYVTVDDECYCCSSPTTSSSSSSSSSYFSEEGDVARNYG